MEVRVLGCYGSQIPGFTTSSFLVGDSLLLDAGSVTSKLSLEEQAGIRSILVSHAHIDHTKDILFLSENALRRDSQTIQVLSTKKVVKSIKKHLLNWEIWPDFTRLPNAKNPLVQLKIIPVGKLFSVEGRRVLAFRSNHTVAAVGFGIEGDEGWLLYSGDTGPNPGMWKVANSLQNLKVIIVDVSFPNEMEELARVSGHLTPRMLESDIASLVHREVKIFASHMKPPHQDVLARELSQISGRTVTLLSPEMKITV